MLIYGHWGSAVAVVITGGDLYVTISQRVSSDLLVQMWGCQAGRDTSFCRKNKFKVENIKIIETGLGQWKDTQNHSKWCVVKDPKNNWVCVADVNRAPSQHVRRGGALCIKDKRIKDIFLKFCKTNWGLSKQEPPGHPGCPESSKFPEHPEPRLWSIATHCLKKSVLL